MESSTLTQQLTEIGLSEKEAKVYMALLNGGALTADQTAKRARLNRSTTYVQIESLINKGLASTFKKGKKTFFSAESPNNLERLLDVRELDLKQQRANVQFLLPELMQQYSAGDERPLVKMYEGKGGITTLRNLVLDAANKTVHVISDITKLQEIYNEEERNEYSRLRSKKGITTKVLYSIEDNKPDLVAVAPQQLKRLSRTKFPFDSDIYIFDDCTGFVSCGEHIHGVLIQSALIANTMRTIHKMLWES